MSIQPELIEIVLDKFQAVLEENLAYPWPSKCGPPPQYGYVEQKAWTEGDSSGNETGLAAWNIATDGRETTAIKGWGIPKINGMFFDYLRGWFYISPDLSVVHINWQIGPRFGRGFKHQISKDSQGHYMIDQGKETWIS